jgi:hypothetical protein
VPDATVKWLFATCKNGLLPYAKTASSHLLKLLPVKKADFDQLKWLPTACYIGVCHEEKLTACHVPTIEGKTARGASSPANPALHMPDPLSTTKAVVSSSHIF